MTDRLLMAYSLIAVLVAVGALVLWHMTKRVRSNNRDRKASERSLASKVKERERASSGSAC